MSAADDLLEARKELFTAAIRSPGSCPPGTMQYLDAVNLRYRERLKTPEPDLPAAERALLRARLDVADHVERTWETGGICSGTVLAACVKLRAARVAFRNAGRVLRTV